MRFLVVQDLSCPVPSSLELEKKSKFRRTNLKVVEPDRLKSALPVIAI